MNSIEIFSKNLLNFFRGGYAKEHYPTEIEWNSRLNLEQSLAIKIPWIGFDLAGAKKSSKMSRGSKNFGKNIHRTAILGPGALGRLLGCVHYPAHLDELKSSMNDIPLYRRNDEQLSRLNTGA